MVSAHALTGTSLATEGSVGDVHCALGPAQYIRTYVGEDTDGTEEVVCVKGDIRMNRTRLLERTLWCLTSAGRQAQTSREAVYC